MNELDLPQSTQGSVWHLFPNLLFVAVIKHDQKLLGEKGFFHLITHNLS